MILDTGSSHTIVKPNIVAHCRIQNTDEDYQLETANGEVIPVKGIHLAEIRLGNSTFRQKVFVADITDDVLLGLNVMAEQNFILDLPQRVLKTNNEEIILNFPKIRALPIRTVKASEDVEIPPQSEVVLEAICDDSTEEDETVIVEPKSENPLHHKGILTARTLTVRKNNQMFVRIMNLKDYPQKVSKGEPIGTCQTAEVVIMQKEVPRPAQTKTLPGPLQEMMKKSRPLLCPEEVLQRTKLDGPEEWGADTLAREQQEDPDVGDIVQWKMEGKERPAWQEISNRSPTFKGYWALWDSLAIENNLLKRVWESPDGKEKNYQTILPRKRVPEVLQAVHSGVGGGHFGINKTLDKVRERFYWLGSRSDVEEWCRRCETCAASKGPRTRKLRLPIDLISDRPKKEEGVNNYISHLQDRLKLTHAEVRQKMRIESDRMKTRYDLRANTGGFQVGEKVWLYNPKRTKGKSPKLQKSWEGPYIVVTRLNDVVYRIQKNPQAKMKIVHIDRLTPYQEPHPNEGNSLDFYKLLDSSKLVYKPGKFGREEVFKLLTVDTATSLRFVTFAAECKEKWRSLRTDFMGKMKPPPSVSGVKKKTYYLETAMQFCLPFIKTLAPPSSGNLPSVPLSSTNDEVGAVENSEISDPSGSKMDIFCPVQSSQASPTRPSPCNSPALSQSKHSNSEQQKRDSSVQFSPCTRAKKSFTPRKKSAAAAADADQSVAEYFRAKKTKIQQTEGETRYQKIERQEGLKMFLLNMLPEQEELSDSQIKYFKRRILSLIDEILTPSQDHNQVSTPILSPQSDFSSTPSQDHYEISTPMISPQSDFSSTLSQNHHQMPTFHSLLPP
ncbi:hypothetical protein NQ315_011007 [Exocentrus adspersus]|uniref:RNA-directed DNA polymerase n=1 Tax=Exocentrus adspersus TaxID=1586481 RepID=A0AAV8VJA6_9CUCU|nr:hypothetical protein NQ315_011007 [Exocentrus adspersus]